MAKKNTRLWQMSDRQYDNHCRRKSDRALRKAGFSSRSEWDFRYRRRTFYNDRLDKVRDPRSAFMYLMDNFMGQNSGKLLESRSSSGKYYWIERDREADVCYFIVRKRGNHVVVTRRRWVVNGAGVNTFIGGLSGFDHEPVCEETVILRHPIMKVETFLKAYAEAAPSLNVWLD